jgi:hypothetical protein
MAELNFQTSRKTYTVNGDAEISFDPADISFVHKMYTLLDKLKEEWEKPAPDPEDVFAVSALRDQQMRQEIDKAFGDAVCDKVFGSTNIFSPAGGMPVCLNFIMAVIDEIDAASEKEIKPSARTEEYLRKFKAKYGK